MSNGLKFDRDGKHDRRPRRRLRGRMLVKTDMRSGKTYILTGLFEGKPYHAAQRRLDRGPAAAPKPTSST
jgi:gluconolactonase